MGLGLSGINLRPLLWAVYPVIVFTHRKNALNNILLEFGFATFIVLPLDRL